LSILRRRRYEIESYLIHPVALLRFIEGPGDPTLWGTVARQRAETYLREHLPPASFAAPTTDDPFLLSEAASKSLLPGLFEAADVEMYKRDCDLVALSMRPDEIPTEVRDKLDQICDVLGPGRPTSLPPTAPPVPDEPNGGPGAT
jgi:hypothetical protein